MMKKDRTLNWDGCTNVRELGGLETREGRKIRWGALVRSDHPEKLTSAGWAALYAHGVRMIISLRTDGMDEEVLEIPEEYGDIELVLAPIEDVGDEEFLETYAKTNLWGTPLYYKDAIQRWPERHATVFKAMAGAQEGAVLFHCARGVDRTGIISLMALSLLGVPEDVIVEDYELSADLERDELLAERGTNSAEVIKGALEGLDMDKYLLGAGMGEAEIVGLRGRFLEGE